MNAFTFPIGKLKGILLFAAKGDIRYYLNGVYFTKAPNGKGMIAVATDGHRLTVIYHEQDVSTLAADFAVIIPREHIEHAVKFPIKTENIACDAAMIVDGVKATIRTAIVVECNALEGKYPDYQRVIPKMNKREPSNLQVSAAYMVDYLKLGQALGQKTVGLTVSTNGENNVVVVDVGDTCAICIIMPMRTDADLSDREWLKAAA